MGYLEMSNDTTYVYSDLDPVLTVNGVTGGVVVYYDTDAINESIRTILATASGERVRNPIGANLLPLLFEPMDDDLVEMMRSEINRALSLYEDRITLSGVQVTPNYDKNFYDITIRYSVDSTNKTGEVGIKMKSFGV